MNKNNKTNKKKEPILLLNKYHWGWVAVFTNGLSVIIQMYNLIKTKSAQSFSIKFIFLMWLLNFWYFIIAILKENIGFALATLSFVIYNSSVIFYYYCGLNGVGSIFCNK